MLIMVKISKFSENYLLDSPRVSGIDKKIFKSPFFRTGRLTIVTVQTVQRGAPKASPGNRPDLSERLRTINIPYITKRRR